MRSPRIQMVKAREVVVEAGMVEVAAAVEVMVVAVVKEVVEANRELEQKILWWGKRPLH